MSGKKFYPSPKEVLQEFKKLFEEDFISALFYQIAYNAEYFPTKTIDDFECGWSQHLRAQYQYTDADIDRLRQQAKKRFCFKPEYDAMEASEKAKFEPYNIYAFSDCYFIPNEKAFAILKP